MHEVRLSHIKSSCPFVSHILAKGGWAGLSVIPGICIFVVIFYLYILAECTIVLLGPNTTFFTPPHPFEYITFFSGERICALVDVICFGQKTSYYSSEDDICLLERIHFWMRKRLFLSNIRYFFKVKKIS